MTPTETLEIPPAEIIDVGKLSVDGNNPNQLGKRQFETLKKSIKRWGFIVPIITNKDFLIADGEHRLEAAKALGMKQISVIRLPVSDVDRRMIRQVMNKIRGEHDLFLDAEEYYRLVSQDSRGLLKELLNENNLRIDNLLKLREPFVTDDLYLKELAGKFKTRIESNELEQEWKTVQSNELLTLKCHVEFSTKTDVTPRTLAICEAFGLGVDETQHFMVFDNFSLDFHKGDLIYMTGDSGGGKSLLLKAFKDYFGDESLELSNLEINPAEVLIEGVGNDVKEAIEILSLCGLNDAFLFLRRFRELSDGQKYRYRLAKLINEKEKSIWIIDEFCTSLDRDMAKIVAHLIQKVARNLSKTVVVATTHRDLVEDFQPDIMIDKGYERDVEVTRNVAVLKKCSLYDKIRIEKGMIEDYEKLSRFHYRSKEDEEASSLRIKGVYKLLFSDDLIGVIVYSHSYLNLKPRNIVFGDRYCYTPGDFNTARMINDEIARISPSHNSSEIQRHRPGSISC